MRCEAPWQQEQQKLRSRIRGWCYQASPLWLRMLDERGVLQAGPGAAFMELKPETQSSWSHQVDRTVH